MLTEEERARLRLFRSRTKDLRSCGLIRGGPTTVTVHIAGRIPDEVVEGLNEDHLKSFLVTLRQFTLQGETVNFESVCNLIRRSCERQELLPHVDGARARWRDALNSPIGMSLNGKKYSVEELLKLLLYGGVVHSDLDKSPAVDALSAPVRGLFRLFLVRQLNSVIRPVVVLDAVIDAWLDNPTTPFPPIAFEDDG